MCFASKNMCWGKNWQMKNYWLPGVSWLIMTALCFFCCPAVNAEKVADRNKNASCREWGEEWKAKICKMCPQKRSKMVVSENFLHITPWLKVPTWFFSERNVSAFSAQKSNPIPWTHKKQCFESMRRRSFLDIECTAEDCYLPCHASPRTVHRFSQHSRLGT